MKRIAVIVPLLMLGAILCAACATTNQTTAASSVSTASATGVGLSQAPLNESKLSLASPPSAPSQPAADVPPEKHQADSVLEIAPAQLPAAFNPPSADQAAGSAPPDAGSAKDYLNQSPAALDPIPTFAGASDYMNQQADYESIGTGLPANALLPPPMFFPYYYPYISRVYYPIYTPAPIFVSRPPSYAPLPSAFQPVHVRPSPFHSFGRHH